MRQPAALAVLVVPVARIRAPPCIVSPLATCVVLSWSWSMSIACRFGALRFPMREPQGGTAGGGLLQPLLPQVPAFLREWVRGRYTSNSVSSTSSCSTLPRACSASTRRPKTLGHDHKSVAHPAGPAPKALWWLTLRWTSPLFRRLSQRRAGAANDLDTCRPSPSVIRSLVPCGDQPAGRHPRAGTLRCSTGQAAIPEPA